jgi:hypothetical protein
MQIFSVGFAMTTPESDENRNREETTARAPTPFPYWLSTTWWVSVGLMAGVGGYTGWWGADYFHWQPILGLIGMGVGICCLGAIGEWFLRLGSIRFWHGLLGLLLVYGVIYGIFIGLFLAFLAAMLCPWLGWIADRNLRTAVGIIIGLLSGGFFAWGNSRRRKKASLTVRSDDEGANHRSPTASESTAGKLDSESSPNELS